MLRAFTILAIMSVGVPASAAPLALPSPIAPIPSTPGTGLWSRWATAPQGSFNELDTALTFLSSPSAIRVDGVGPINLSNFLAPLGDFPQHGNMPFSPLGQPSAGGQFVVGSMQGWWAARSAGIYSLGLGCDDGFRVQIAGLDVLDHAPSQAFRRVRTVLNIATPGLYAIRVDYFNGVEEGAIELSIADGDVAIVSPTSALPQSFALVPREDLYPFDSVVAADAGADLANPWSDAAAPVGDGGSSGDPGEALAADPLSEKAWRGGGCQSAPCDGGFGGALTFVLGIASAFWRRRRAA